VTIGRYVRLGRSERFWTRHAKTAKKRRQPGSGDRTWIGSSPDIGDRIQIGRWVGPEEEQRSSRLLGYRETGGSSTVFHPPPHGVGAVRAVAPTYSDVAWPGHCRQFVTGQMRVAIANCGGGTSISPSRRGSVQNAGITHSVENHYVSSFSCFDRKLTYRPRHIRPR